jgi:DNA (cytosine-5)-methyltransferase 1
MSTGQAGAEIGIGIGIGTTLNCNHEAPIVTQPYSIMPMNSGKDFKARPTDVAQPIMAGGQTHGNQGGDVIVTHSLRGEGFDASEDGTGRGTPLVPVAFDTTQITSPENGSNPQPGDPCHPLAAGAHPPAIVYSMITANTGANGLGVAAEVAPTLDRAQPCAVAFAQNQRDEVRTMEVAGALAGEPGMKQQTFVATSFKAKASFGLSVGVGVSGTLEAVNPTAVAFVHQAGGAQTTLGYDPERGTSPTLSKCQTVAVAAFKGGQGSGAGSIGYSEHLAPTLPSADGGNRTPTLMQAMQVRRLTPVECERLQGFPDDYTLIPHRNKPAADGPRYKALGNSMAVPVMAWIGKRIQQVEDISA